MTTPDGHRRYRRSEIVAALEQTPGASGQQRIEDAVRLYDEGWPIRRVAGSFDMSYGAMRTLLSENTRLRERGEIRASRFKSGQ